MSGDIATAEITPPRTQVRRWVRIGLASLAALCAAITFLSIIGRSAAPIELVPGAEPPSEEATRLYDESVRRIASARPRGIWLAVDTHDGRMRTYRGDKLLHESSCSTGSGLSLRDPRTGRVWTFQTPIGERSILRKVRDPIWTKPDWAFIEEGYEPPGLGARDRRDDFSLGAYALHLGDGYMIHGTVFQTLVGRPITHGCIRLRDKDLEYVYKTAPLGARVLLY